MTMLDEGFEKESLMWFLSCHERIKHIIKQKNSSYSGNQENIIIGSRAHEKYM